MNNKLKHVLWFTKSVLTYVLIFECYNKLANNLLFYISGLFYFFEFVCPQPQKFLFAACYFIKLCPKSVIKFY